MSAAIETNGLVKTFGATRAVNGIGLSIARGTVYGLLGPNGAGKTTTIRVLATLLKPDGGSARVLGHDVAREPAAVRAKVSLTGQFASVDEDLCGHENLVLIARLLGFTWRDARSRATELLGAFDLADIGGRQVRTYSGGMRRRLDIAASFVVTSERLFLTVYTGVGLNTDIQKGLFDRFRSLPIWQPAPIVGALLGDLMRYALAALVVMVVGLVMCFRPEAGPLGVVIAVALMLVFASAVSWIWIIVGFLVRTPESVITTSFLLLFPLTFVSNIFVDPATMPAWLQAVVALNPVTHLATASRGLVHGGVLAADVLWVLIASVVITTVFAPIALRMYYRER